MSCQDCKAKDQEIQSGIADIMLDIAKLIKHPEDTLHLDRLRNKIKPFFCDDDTRDACIETATDQITRAIKTAKNDLSHVNEQLMKHNAQYSGTNSSQEKLGEYTGLLGRAHSVISSVLDHERKLLDVMDEGNKKNLLIQTITGESLGKDTRDFINGTTLKVTPEVTVEIQAKALERQAKILEELSKAKAQCAKETMEQINESRQQLERMKAELLNNQQLLNKQREEVTTANMAVVTQKVALEKATQEVENVKKEATAQKAELEKAKQAASQARDDKQAIEQEKKELCMNMEGTVALESRLEEEKKALEAKEIILSAYREAITRIENECDSSARGDMINDRATNIIDKFNQQKALIATLTADRKKSNVQIDKQVQDKISSLEREFAEVCKALSEHHEGYYSGVFTELTQQINELKRPTTTLTSELMDRLLKSPNTLKLLASKHNKALQDINKEHEAYKTYALSHDGLQKIVKELELQKAAINIYQPGQQQFQPQSTLKVVAQGGTQSRLLGTQPQRNLTVVAQGGTKSRFLGTQPRSNVKEKGQSNSNLYRQGRAQKDDIRRS